MVHRLAATDSRVGLLSVPPVSPVCWPEYYCRCNQHKVGVRRSSDPAWVVLAWVGLGLRIISFHTLCRCQASPGYHYNKECHMWCAWDSVPNAPHWLKKSGQNKKLSKIHANFFYSILICPVHLYLLVHKFVFLVKKILGFKCNKKPGLSLKGNFLKLTNAA